MKIKLITTASDPNHPGWLQLKRSLDHFGWDYHLIVHEYTGYNSKIVAFYNYLIETRWQVDRFLYSDSYDTFALAGPEEVENKLSQLEGLVYGTEKACWPYGDWAAEYPESPFETCLSGRQARRLERLEGCRPCGAAQSHPDCLCRRAASA